MSGVYEHVFRLKFDPPGGGLSASDESRCKMDERETKRRVLQVNEVNDDDIVPFIQPAH